MVTSQIPRFENDQTISNSRLGFTYVPGHSIGDWGKEPKYWPDLGNTTNYGRRFGANFNFGAMTASDGLDIDGVLVIAQALALGRHPADEQRAIAAGYYWWLNATDHALHNKEQLSIDLLK